MKASPGRSVTYELIVNGHSSPLLPVWRIGANSFQPDVFAEYATDTIPIVDQWCADHGVQVRFVATKRHVGIYETAPLAAAGLGTLELFNPQASQQPAA